MNGPASGAGGDPAGPSRRDARRPAGWGRSVGRPVAGGRAAGDRPPGGRRLAVWGAVVVVALAAAWYAGTASPPPAAGPSAGTVRLGPEPGEDVAAYLARVPAELPAPGARALALVQFAAEVPAADALAAVAPATPVTAVYRVAFPRVQTALRFERLEPGVEPARAFANARERARAAAEADAARLPGRAGAVAAAEARALADPACRCVLALLVEGGRAALAAVAARPGVRAVHAAPAGALPVEIALSPLLPGQDRRADPLPDDGVPPA